MVARAYNQGLKPVASLLVVAAALAVPGAAAPANEARFSDARDDGDPDVADVVVTNNNGGFLSIRVAVANMPQLGRDTEFLVGFDTDRNAATGGEGGAEYVLGVLGRGFSFFLRKWAGTAFIDYSHTQPVVLYRDGLQIVMDYTDLGRPASFDLFVRGSRGERMDRSPDTGAWRYEVRITPELESIEATFAPSVPVAGKIFALRTVLVGLSTRVRVRPANIRCRVVLGGREFGTKCRFRVPANAAGKRLRVHITASYGSDRATFAPYVFRVRG